MPLRPHLLSACLALFALLAFTAQAAGPAPDDLAPGLLDTHNAWRAQVGVAPLRWADDLAADAGRWAATLAHDGCRMRHSPDAERPDAGENLFWASPLRWSDGRTEVQAVDGRQVADAWAGERADYDHARNSCTPGKPCGHYTQMVWRGSRELGCARQVCADRAQLWVCRYRPAGNYVGERPY